MHCFLAFDSNRKKNLHYPYSTCGCYDGRHACSHFAGFLLLIRCVQRCDHNQNTFENSLPNNPLKLQNQITLIECAGFTNKYKVSKKMKLQENKILSCNENGD